VKTAIFYHSEILRILLHSAINCVPDSV